MNFLHIGGGAGDLDPAANFKDGFSEFVKKYKTKNKNIFIVEANPSNILTLKKSWTIYQSVKIFNLAITNKKSKKLKFFFSEQDAPFYQLFSTNFNHVSSSKVKLWSIVAKERCMSTALFFAKNVYFSFEFCMRIN